MHQFSIWIKEVNFENNSLIFLNIRCIKSCESLIFKVEERILLRLAELNEVLLAFDLVMSQISSMVVILRNNWLKFNKVSINLSNWFLTILGEINFIVDYSSVKHSFINEFLNFQRRRTLLTGCLIVAHRNRKWDNKASLLPFSVF